MAHSDRGSQRLTLRKTCILAACLVTASVSVSLTVASPAGATSADTRSSVWFAGYEATPNSPKSETAQVHFKVPAVTCQSESDLSLVIFQWMEYSRGFYLGSFVQIGCDSGTPQYSASAYDCGLAACGGCSSSEISVSPGDSVTLSESAIEGNTMPEEATVADNTNDNGVYCVEYGGFPDPGPVYTGACGGDPFGGDSPGSPSSTTPPPYGLVECQYNPPQRVKVPEFAPVEFRGAGVDGKSLESWKPSQYDMSSGTTVQVESGNFADGGEAFRDIFVHH